MVPDLGFEDLVVSTILPNPGGLHMMTFAPSSLDHLLIVDISVWNTIGSSEVPFGAFSLGEQANPKPIPIHFHAYRQAKWVWRLLTHFLVLETTFPKCHEWFESSSESSPKLYAVFVPALQAYSHSASVGKR